MRIRIDYGQLFPGRFYALGSVVHDQLVGVTRRMKLSYDYHTYDEIVLIIRELRKNYKGSIIKKVTCKVDFFFLEERYTPDNAVKILESLNHFCKGIKL